MNRRGTKWYAKRIFGLVGLIWFFQLFAFLGIILVDLGVHGWSDSRKAPIWIDVWGIIGVFIPTIGLVVVMLGYMTYAFVQWFRGEE